MAMTEMRIMRMMKLMRMNNESCNFNIINKVQKQAARLISSSSSSSESESESEECPEFSSPSEIKNMKTTPGGGYGMRADEQGYGGVHQGNSSISSQEEDKFIRGSPEYNSKDEVPPQPQPSAKKNDP